MWDGINWESGTDMDTLTDEQDPLYSTGISAQYSYNKTILHHTFQSPYLYFLYSQANDLYWKVSYDKSRHILKSKDITLPTKVHIVKVMDFPWSCTDGRIGP